jgi:uncharacterized protein DUF6335
MRMEREMISLDEAEEAEERKEAAESVENPTEENALEADAVDEVGAAIGVTYQDDESLLLGEKETERDRHRWELDPASAEDYVERTHQHVEGVDEQVLHMNFEDHVPHRR